MTKKLIFLDINGVLGSSQHSDRENVIAGKSRDPSNVHVWYFYPPYVKRLENLIERTNAKIVVCSSCRKVYTLDEIRDYIHRAGAPKAADAIIDSTPGNKLGVRKHRGREVALWLALSDEYHDANYVIVDDATDYYDNQKAKFVHVNSVYGLQDCDVDLAVSILNDVWNKKVLF